MDEKKIKYPFRNFVKNILIGVILLLSIFTMVPVVNNALSRVDSGEDVVADGNASIYVYGYYSNGTLRELEYEKNSDGALWWKETYTTYTYEKSGNQLYWTTDPNQNDLDGEDKYAIGDGDNRYVPGNSTVYFLPETYRKDSKGFHVVAIFKGRGIPTSGTGKVVAVQSTGAHGDDFIQRKLGAYLNAGETYSILVAHDTLRLNLSLNRKVSVGDYTWSSPMVGGSESICKHLGEYAEINAYPKNGFSLSSNSIIGNGNYFMTKDGYGRWALTRYDINSRTLSSTTVDCDINFNIGLDAVYTPENGSWVTSVNGRPVFNIGTADQLQMFANEVNYGEMNIAVKDRYTAVLTSNISYYNGDPIGNGEGNSAFKGTFDGNGKTIGTANINPVIKTGWDRYSREKDEFVLVGWSWNNLYCRGVDFGFFTYVDGGTVENLTVNKINSNSYQGFRRTDDGANEYLGENTLIPWADSKIGLLCGSNNGGIFRDVSITGENNLKILQKMKAGLKIGGLAGEMKDKASATRCAINTFSFTVEKENRFGIMSLDSPDDDAQGNYYIGGLAGVMTYSTRIQDSEIETFNIGSGSWQKHNGLNFYAGGLVGRVEGGEVQRTRVLGGTLNLSNVYLTEDMGIGGLVGSMQKGSKSSMTRYPQISNCLSKVNIVVENLVNSGLNADSDFPSFGGLVGIVGNGAWIKFCRFESENYVLKSGASRGKSGWNPSTWFFSETYDVYFGGLIGMCANDPDASSSAFNINIENSSCYIPNGVQSNDTVIESYLFGLFIGNAGRQTSESADKTIWLTNCYSIIGGNGKKSLNDSGLTSDKGPGLYWGDIGAKSPSVINITNCYKSTYGLDANNRRFELWGNDRSYGVGIIESNIVDMTSETDQKLNNLFGVYNDKDGVGFPQNTSWWGYNRNFPNKMFNGQAAPFNKFAYKKSVNILIDCTKVKDGRAVSLSKNENGYAYTRTGNTVIYIYGSAVAFQDFENRSAIAYILPTVTLGSNGKVVSYYSTIKTGKNDDGTPSIFAYPGDAITVEDTNETNVTLYPIFSTEFYVYSPTKLTVNGSKENIVENGKTVGAKYSKVNVEIDGVNLYCNVMERQISSNGIYTYYYLISFDNNDTIEGLTATNIKQILGEALDNNNYTLSYTKNSLEGTNGIVNLESYNENKYSINYIPFLNGSINAEKYTKSDDVKAGEVLFTHVYKMASFYAASLVRDENNNYVKINGSYATNYQQVKEIPIFFGDLSFKGVTINVDLDGATNCSLFKPIIVSENNKNKTAYNVSGHFVYESNANVTPSVPLNDEYQKPGIYDKNANSGGTYFPTDNLTYGQIHFYMLYQELGLIIRYHKTSVIGSESKQDKIEFGEYVEGTKSGSNIYTYLTHDLGSIKAKDYVSLFGINEHTYAFTGWKLRVCFNEGDNNKKNFDDDVFIFPERDFDLVIPNDWVGESRSITFDLYPVFVTYYNNSIYFDTNKYGDLTTTNFNVYTEQDLIYIANQVNLGKKLNININLRANLNMLGYRNFMPIGYIQKTPFIGNFYGNGFTISNLTIETEAPLAYIRVMDTYEYVNRNSTILGFRTNHPLMLQATGPSIYVGLFGYVSYSNTTPHSTFNNVNLIDIYYNIKSNWTSEELWNVVIPETYRIKGSANNNSIKKSSASSRPNIFVGGLIGRGENCSISNVLIQGSLFNNQKWNLRSSNASANRSFFGGICGMLSGKSDSNYALISNCITNFGLTLKTEEKYEWYYAFIGTILGICGEYVHIQDSFDLSDANSWKGMELDKSIAESDKVIGDYVLHNGIRAGIFGAMSFTSYEEQGYYYGGYFGLGVLIENYYTTFKYLNIKNYESSLSAFGPSSGEVVKNVYHITSLGNNLNFEGFDSSSSKVSGTCTKQDLFNKIKSNSWTIDGANNGLPYLKNTGITTANFVIDGNSCITTPEDQARFSELGVKKIDNKYVYTKKFFILDLYGKRYTNLYSAGQNIGNSWYGNEDLIKELGIRAYYLSSKFDLIGNLDGFANLEGYVIDQDISTYFNRTDYNGIYIGADNGVYNKKRIWRIMKDSGIDMDYYKIIKAQIVDWVLNNNQAEIRLLFNEKKSVKVNYTVEINGNIKNIYNFDAKFGDKVTIENINDKLINSTNDELKNLILGKQIVGYEIKLNNKNVFVNIDENGNLVYTGNNDYKNGIYNTNNAGNESYPYNTKFNITIIDNPSNGVYNLFITAREKNIKDIEYKLNFFEFSQEGINEKVYNTFTKNGDEYVIKENGDLNYFVLKYNQEVVGDNRKLMPVYEKAGYVFNGWGYYVNGELKMFSRNDAKFNMPELRISPYNAKIDENGYCSLDLYPLLDKDTFKVNYYDGFDENQDEIDLNKLFEPNDTTYMSNYTLYNDKMLSEVSSLYSSHVGWKLSGYKFKETTKDRINGNGPEGFSDKVKGEIVELLTQLATKMNYDFDYTKFLKEGETTKDISVTDFIKLHLAEICEDLFNHILNNCTEDTGLLQSFEYFIPCSIDIICLYDRVDYDTAIYLSDSDNALIKYTITDALTGEISSLFDMNFENIEAENSSVMNFDVNKKFVITTKYNNIINIYTYLRNGTMINEIKCSNNDYLNFSMNEYRNNIVTLGYDSEHFTNKVLPILANNQLGKINNGEFVGISENIDVVYDIKDYHSDYYNSSNGGNYRNILTKDEDGYYLIKNVGDLVEYSENVISEEYDNDGNIIKEPYYKAKLTNNLDLLGIKININYIPQNYILDGQNYTINGLTNYDIDFSCVDKNYDAIIASFSFIYSNFGTIKNLNFDNVCINISASSEDLFGLIVHNYGTIESVNILGGFVVINSLKSVIKSEESQGSEDGKTADLSYIGGLVGENIVKDSETNSETVGKIEKVSVNLNLEVLGDKEIIYSGLLVGRNEGEIESIVTKGFIKNDMAQNESYISFVVGYFAGGKINNVITKNSESKNLEGAKTITSAIVGYLVSIDTANITNILNLSKNVDKLVGDNLSNTAWKITSFETSEKTNKILKTYNLSAGNVEEYEIEGVNIQLVKTYVESLVENKTLKSKITEKLNTALKDVNSKEVIYFSIELNNRMQFGSDSYKQTALQRKDVFLSLFVEGFEHEQTSKFDVSYILNNDDRTISSNAKILESRTASTEQLNFEYKAKEFVNFSFNISYDEDSLFTDAEKTLIEKGIKLYINKDINNEPFALQFHEDGDPVTIFDNNGNEVKVKYFDEVTIEFNLPSVAFLSTDGGLIVNGKTIEETHRKFNYVYSIKCEDGNAIIIADIERRIIELTLDLNLDSIEDEVEKAKISFNENYVQNILVNKLGYEAKINELNQVVINVAPTLTDNGFVYYLPDLIYNLDGIVSSIFNYESNGINYKLAGFNNDEKLFYDEALGKAIETFEYATTIYAKYDKVEYTIEIDNLEKRDVENLNSSCYYPNANGYRIEDKKARKEFSYFDKLALPETDKIEYRTSYIFKGYKIDDGTADGLMIADAIISGEGENKTTTIVIRPEFERLTDKLTRFRNSNEYKIVLIPVFEEVKYTLTFKDGFTDDGYNTHLYFEDSNYDSNQYSEYKIENITISQIFAGNFVLPVGFKEHHKFIGYAFDGEDDLIINYIESAFELDCPDLLGNLTFVAKYKIDTIDVKIEVLDKNSGLKLDYEIVDLEDLKNKNIDYTIDEDKNILFKLNYDTTSFVLPQIKLFDENYLFSNFVIGDINYTQFYTFQSDVTINIVCDYRVLYFTKYGEIVSSYNLFKTNDTFKRDDSLTYSFYAKYNTQITLPLAEEVQRTGFTLTGFKLDGEEITSLTVTNPCSVEFVYTGLTYTLTLNTETVKAVLPASLICEYIESYEKLSDYSAEIKVGYGTKVDDIKSNLPKLDADGYTFVGYEFEESDVITKNGNIIANFVMNTYTIEVYEIDGSLVSSITKHFGETIEDNFFKDIDDACSHKAQSAGSIYQGLSLDQKYYVEFNKIQTMTRLEKEYPDLVTLTGNDYILKLYCNYLSNVQVNILAHENSMITLNNTKGLTDFRGGLAYNAGASFKIETESIVSKRITLPVPQIESGSLLSFARFAGYSTEIDGNKVLVVDKDGKLLENFEFLTNVNLTQEFEYKNYDVKIYARYDSIKDLTDEKTTNYGFVKTIKFGEDFGKLPVLEIQNYVFKGYYFSLNDKVDLVDSDIKVVDSDGKVLSEFAKFNKKYFDKLDNEYILKNLYAKYESKTIEVEIKSENTKIGLIGSVSLLDGTTISYRQTENGIIASVPCGKDIMISTIVNQIFGTFKEYAVFSGEVDVTDSCNIQNKNNETTIIKNVTESYVIIARFNYITFNIEYIVDDEKQDLLPNEFNIDSAEFELPNFEKYGYNFMGWYLEKEFVNKVESINPSSYSTSLTLYGNLESKKVNINVYSNNVEGYNLLGSVEVVYNKPIETLPVVVLDGYNFVGFFTTTDKSGVRIENGSLSVFTQDQDVYAIFEQKMKNTLTGEGTLNKPYLIKNKEDFKIFASLVNFENISPSTYFKLTNSITLDEFIVINGFGANFDGDGHVIYVNNSLYGFNKLIESGEIVKNISLFGENKGTISNLIVALKQTEIKDLVEINNPEFVKNDLIINLSVLANKNQGTIENVVVYFVVQLNELNLQFNAVCENSENLNNVSIYNSSVLDSKGLKTFNDVKDIHLVQSVKTSVSKNGNGQYEVSSIEEFAGLLDLEENEISVMLKNNIDFKGKIFEKFDKNLTIYGKGYALSNIICLDSEYAFNYISLNKVAIENTVFLNFNQSGNFILNSSIIENSYIEFDASNFGSLISSSLAKINNSYFTIKNEEAKLIENAGFNVNNGYAIGLNIENITGTNFVALDVEQAQDFVLSAKQYNSDNGQENLWFVDINKVLGDNSVPRLKGVGNVVWNFVYDKETVQVGALFVKVLEDEFVVVKEQTSIILQISSLNDQLKVVEILVNSEDKFAEFNKVLSLITLNDSKQNYNTVEIGTELKTYNLQITVNEKGKGNIVKFEENSGEQIIVEVKSGTMFKDINIETIASNGYKFVDFEYYDDNGNLVVTDDLQILKDTQVIAVFKTLISYTLDLSKVTNYFTLGDKLNSWTEVSDKVYEIYLTNENDIENYLPEISKQDYVFNNYSIVLVERNKYEVYPNFSADYVTVNLDYDNLSGLVTIFSENENSQTSPELKVVKKDDKDDYVYNVLRGYEVIMLINFKGTYLTKVFVNESELPLDYSSFVNKDEDVAVDLMFSEDINTIEIWFEEILIETKFEFETEFVNIVLDNVIIDPLTFVVSSRKNNDLRFMLNIDPSKVLDRFEFTSNGEEFEPIFSEENGEYVYSPQKNATIKVILKQKEIIVTVNMTVGGEIEVIRGLEENEIYSESFNFSVEYASNFDFVISALDGYKLSKLSNKTNTLQLANYVKFENIKEDLTLNVEFKKLATWLDLDEDNNPLYFSLTKFDGLGTEANPYLISSSKDLLTLAYNINILNVDYTGVYFKALRRDMTFNLSRYYFNPIVNFNGILLGDNLTLTGVKIYSSKNAALFKELGENAVVKSIVVEGQIEGDLITASIAGVNNGLIIGCASKATINNNNNYFNENNITGGICAINNGTISRSYMTGNIYSYSIKIGGVVGENNLNVDNIYNTGTIYSLSDYNQSALVGGICGENCGEISIGYNDARIIDRGETGSALISGTVRNGEGGNHTDLYFNSNKLSVLSNDAKTFEEMSNNESEIYANFDKNIWLFGKGKLPTLKVMYEYLGSISFSVTFDENLTENEKIVMLELSNGVDQNYGLILENSNKSYKISNLTKGSYTIKLVSALGSEIACDGELELELDETKGEEIKIKITLTKSQTNGYYGCVII